MRRSPCRTPASCGALTLATPSALPSRRYLKTSSPLALDGGAASGRVVNARHADGCADNANGYGCHFNGNIGGKAMRSY